MSNVFVVNRTDTALTIGYDGVMYEFEPNKIVEMPLVGAVKIFGYGLPDKEYVLVRFGWIRMHSELEDGLKRLDRFVITTERPQPDSSLPSAVGIVPLRLEKGVGGKSSSQRAA